MSLSLQNQFVAFCAAYKNQSGFGAKLYHNFSTDLLKSGPKPPLLWLEANACSGDSISMMNAVDPHLGHILCALFEIRYWNALMPEQGEEAVNSILRTAEQPGFYLIVEGAIATAAAGNYNIPIRIADYRLTSLELVRWLAPKAKYVITAGSCAAFGGPSAARPNPSGSKGLRDVVAEPVINVSGCPLNPDWMTGTLAHLLLLGRPEVDRDQRPILFYGQTNHRHCQRRSYFERKTFAKQLGEATCMFELGCMGPVTGADCPYRLWNNHRNWPVKASTPCIGCTNSGFPDQSMPFFTPLNSKMPPRINTKSKQGEV